MTQVQKNALFENTRMWNEAMTYLLVCPFEKEARTIGYLYELNKEKNKILEVKGND